MSFTPQDAQLAFAVLGSASCGQDSYSQLLQPLLVRASTSTAACPLLLALRDILQRKSSSSGSNNNQNAAQSLIQQQMQQYETDLRDAEGQREPLKIARDKLKAELQRVETLLSTAESGVRKASDGVLVCRSLMQSLQQNNEAGLDSAAVSNVLASSSSSSSTSGATAAAGGLVQQSSSSGSFTASASSGPDFTSSSATATGGAGGGSGNQPSAHQPSLPTPAQQHHHQQQQQQQQQHQDPNQNYQNQQSRENQQNTSSSSSRSNSAPVAPPTIEGTIELLNLCRKQGRDDEHRSQLIPAIARVEARLQKPQAVVDEVHGELASAVMSTVLILHESVQVHALRAVLAMLRKIADQPSQQQQDQQNQGSLSSRLRQAGLSNCCDENGLMIFLDLFARGHDDDVKAEVLECLGVLVAESQFVDVICALGAVPPLVQLIATSTSEPVLERALLLFWSLAAASESVREQALSAGGIRALVDLLYTDSLPILDNTMIALGYLSRDERAKVALAEGGGLEKIVSCLYHPNASVLVKASGVVWNAAVVDSNRTHLRNLGAVPALLQLLRFTTSELARENISGALWNLTIDGEAKKQLADYEGLQMFVQLLAPSHSENVLENASGTLWNCSATVDNRAALRRHGALPPLLALLEHPSERIQENVAGAIRNLVINDHNKVAIRECGGIETILAKLNHSWKEVQQQYQQQQQQQHNNNNSQSPPNSNFSSASGVIDKLVSTLWILTVTPENCQRLQPALSLLLNFAASPILPLAVREKVVGTLRHCCRLPDNRKPLVQLGAFRVLTNFAASLGLAVPCEALPSVQNVQNVQQTTSITLRENFAYTLWNLAREDREAGRKAGALGVIVALLADPNDNVVEFAAGAAAAVINHTSNDGRNELGLLGGVDRLIDVLLNVLTRVSRPTSSSSDALIVLLHNTIHALRYATSQNCERNISLVLDRPEDIVAKLIGLVESPPSSNSQTTGGAISSDDITRESILFIKNILASQSDLRIVQNNDVLIKCSSLSDRLEAIIETAAAAAAAQSGNQNNEAATLLHRAAQSLHTLLRSKQ